MAVGHPWPCVYEFLAIVTHPRIFVTPMPLDSAIDQVQAWMESPTLALLGEGPGYWDRLSEVLLASRVGGPVVHDAPNSRSMPGERSLRAMVGGS